MKKTLSPLKGSIKILFIISFNIPKPKREIADSLAISDVGIGGVIFSIFVVSLPNNIARIYFSKTAIREPRKLVKTKIVVKNSDSLYRSSLKLFLS